jgi:hypothetical protein
MIILGGTCREIMLISHGMDIFHTVLLCVLIYYIRKLLKDNGIIANMINTLSKKIAP